MRRNMIVVIVLIVVALVSLALTACDDAGSTSGRGYNGSQGGFQISYDNSPVIVSGKGFYSPDCVDETGWNGCTAKVVYEVSGAQCVMARAHPDYGTNVVNGFVRVTCGGKNGWVSVNNVVRQ